MSNPGDETKPRSQMGYLHARCSLCPHGATMHEVDGRCLAPDCECPGYEPDAVLGTAEGIQLPPPDLRPKPTAESIQAHQFQQVTPINSYRPPTELEEHQYPTIEVDEVVQEPSVVWQGLEKSDVLRTSHQGGHYHDFAIEPIQYIEANHLPFHEANIVKYVSRWRLKDGLDDLKKARFYLDRLIEISEL